MHRFGVAIVVLLLLATAVTLASTGEHREPIFGVGCFLASVAAWAAGIDPRLHGLLTAISLVVIVQPEEWLFSAGLAFCLAAFSLWVCVRPSTSTSTLNMM